MTGWHLGVMCAFDTETTGPDPETARLVTACISYVDGSGVMPPVTMSWLVDPGIEIPADVTKIHGITTEHARENGQPPGTALREIAEELARSAHNGTPVVAFNAPYDLTLLDRETRRNGLEPFSEMYAWSSGLVIDPFVLDKAVDPYRKGKRNLGAVCEHYGVRLDGAHDSTADATAAARVAWVIANRHYRIASMPLAELHAFQVRAKREHARSFQEFKRSQGSAEVIDGSWPLKPWTEAAA